MTLSHDLVFYVQIRLWFIKIDCYGKTILNKFETVYSLKRLL